MKGKSLSCVRLLLIIYYIFILIYKGVSDIFILEFQKLLVGHKLMFKKMISLCHSPTVWKQINALITYFLSNFFFTV